MKLKSPYMYACVILEYLIPFQDDDRGLNVCLHCFNGGCTGDRDHASLHHKRFGHPLALNIKRTRKNVQVSLFRIKSTYYMTLELIRFRCSVTNPPRKSLNSQFLRRRKRIALIRVQELSATRAARMKWINPVEICLQ